jgi:hypothetical protein
MRNAVEHPEGYSGRLHIQNFTIDEKGNLQEPIWWRIKNARKEYGPIPIVSDMHMGVYNLFVTGEEVLVMWARQNLLMPQLTMIAETPEERRDPNCAIKYAVVLRAAVN